MGVTVKCKCAGTWEREGTGRKEGGRGNPGGPARRVGRQAAEGYTAGKGPLGAKQQVRVTCMARRKLLMHGGEATHARFPYAK